MKEVAYKNNTISEEFLPYPFVLYPGFYGTFFGFKKTFEDSKVFFCSCFMEAVYNYVEHQKLQKTNTGRYDNGEQKYFLDYGEFPQSFIEKIKEENYQDVNSFLFEDNLCHECNKRTPSFRYCVELYGSTFKQNYGWYIKKRAYELGIFENGYEIDDELCPEKIRSLVEIDPKIFRNHSLRNDQKKLYELKKRYLKQERIIWNIVENEVRENFGHKKIGESWTSETILYYIVKKLYPDKNIYRHFRPSFLEGLELDVFIEDFHLGIEYQGIQHYKAVKHWGGEKALKKVQERDKKKKDLCRSKNIHLIYFEYDDELSEEFVLARIKNVINSN